MKVSGYEVREAWQWATIIGLFGWFHGAGLIHAFLHGGLAQGFLAIVFPPYCWLCAIMFIFWLAGGGPFF